MDSITTTDDLLADIKHSQENLILEMIKELCSDNKFSPKLRGKVSRIISDCDLAHHSSLHKLSAADESTSTLLGSVHQLATELTYDEQAELNQALINKIQNTLPKLTTELEALKQTSIDDKKSRKKQMRELDRGILRKLVTLENQTEEKANALVDFLNHKWNDTNKYSDNSSHLLSCKTQILDLKSQILHLQIVHNIYTETNRSLEAYREIHKDLSDSVKETEKRIEHFKSIIESDFK